MTTITYEQALEIIRGMVDEFGSQKAVAEHLDISQAYMGDILAGKRDISDQVARRFGYRRVVFFEKLFAADISERESKK